MFGQRHVDAFPRKGYCDGAAEAAAGTQHERSLASNSEIHG